MKRSLVHLITAILFLAVALFSAPSSADERVMFSYQCTNQHWWTGLVLVNGLSSLDNTITIFVTDQAGLTVGSGTVSFEEPIEQRVGLVADFLDWGTVPQQGTIVLYGDFAFSAVEIIGNDSGGFGVSEQRSE